MNVSALTPTVNCFFITAAMLCCQSVQAQHWSGWMGDQRDGVYRESGVVESIPESGLKVKWRTPIQGGYAGPAVADGRVFVFDYQLTDGEIANDPMGRNTVNGTERLLAIDETTGKELWKHEYDCPYSISYAVGPRCTPTVDGKHVYILGSEGDLRCLKVDDGELVWERSFKKDFSAEVPLWGFSSHPLIVGDLLYTMVGGKGQGVVAFDKLTGKVKWKSLDGDAGYCPPSLYKVGDETQLIVFYPGAVAGLSLEDGAEKWSVPIEPKYGMSICRPMVEGNLMYVSSIGNKALLLKFNESQSQPEVVWQSSNPSKAIHCANSTPMLVDGIVYGSDCSKGSFMAVDVQTGERLWETFEPTRLGEKRKLSHGTAFLTRIGDTDRYFLMSELGDLLMGRLTKEKFESLGRFHVLEPTSEAFGRDVVWSYPAYANRTAYVRNDKEIVAVDLAADTSAKK
jgi:outer membrane protein assembly factor BamB